MCLAKTGEERKHEIVLYFLTFAKDYQPHGHVDKDPRKTEKLDQVVHKQKDGFLADKP